MEVHDEEIIPASSGMNEIFSLRRPRDFRAGVSSGLKSVGKGAIGGAVGLFAAPLWGASQQGLTGFSKGVVTGKANPLLRGYQGYELAHALVSVSTSNPRNV
jgi:hypothetical protein